MVFNLTWSEPPVQIDTPKFVDTSNYEALQYNLGGGGSIRLDRVNIVNPTIMQFSNIQYY